MSRLTDRVLTSLRDGGYLLSLHARNKLDERGIEEWQVIEATEAGTVLMERPAAVPNPVIEVGGQLADGAACKIVWALQDDGRARLVTVHFT
jgi:hypothetical protein